MARVNKEILIGEEARQKMKIGVDLLANAVKATLGPRGRHAAIERPGGPPVVTKDGVTVARHIDLEDSVQNMGAQLVKSVASEANSEAGDGTTTATVLAAEIFNKGLKAISTGSNPVLLKRGIDLAVELVIESLKGFSLPVNDEQTLFHVATISANNDSKLGKMIAEAVSNVGNDGVISVEEAAGNVTEVVYSEGLKIDRGWLNESFITNPARNTCEFSDPYILLVDSEIKSISSLVSILNAVIEVGGQLLIITKNIEQEALAHIILNKIKNVIRACVIRAPGFGDNRKAFMEDLAILTNSKVFNDSYTVDNATLRDLGRARTIVVGANTTKIIDGAGTTVNKQKAIETLKNLLSDDTIFDEQKNIFRDRIARLSGSVAIFKVGATSESELREKKDRVEDAVNAVKSALAEGIVPGGGCALLKASKSLDLLKVDSKLLDEERVGVKIISEAIKAPFFNILINAGMEPDQISHYASEILNSDKFSGYDALQMEYVEDMLSRGIVDPAKVVRSSLQHAASASGTLLTTEVTISAAVTK